MPVEEFLEGENKSRLKSDRESSKLSLMPKFFIPHAESSEQAEDVYDGLAKSSHRSVPPIGERIYSITDQHNGEEWTATVGEQLRGIRRQITGKGMNAQEVETPISDPAIVLAIFPGTPYLVATMQVYINVGSRWESIFMAGEPYGVLRFTPQ